MNASLNAQSVKNAISSAFQETFDDVVGMYLDTGDNLWATLDGVTAEQASVPIASGGNTIAAQIAHMTYYLDVMAEYMRGVKPETDWAAAWKTTSVNEDEWKDLRRALAERQQEILTLINAASEDVFDDPDILGGTYGIVAHNAFHLGQIRHALAAQGV